MGYGQRVATAVQWTICSLAVKSGKTSFNRKNVRALACDQPGESKYKESERELNRKDTVWQYGREKSSSSSDTPSLYFPELEPLCFGTIPTALSSSSERLAIICPSTHVCREHCGRDNRETHAVSRQRQAPAQHHGLRSEPHERLASFGQLA